MEAPLQAVPSVERGTHELWCPAAWGRLLVAPPSGLEPVQVTPACLSYVGTTRACRLGPRQHAVASQPMILSRSFINVNSLPSSSTEVKTLQEGSPWDPEFRPAHLLSELTCDASLAGL